MSQNCQGGGGIAARVGSAQMNAGIGMEPSVSHFGPFDATPGDIVQGEDRPLRIILGCSTPEPIRQVPVPDFDFTATFAVTYLHPDSVRQLN